MRRSAFPKQQANPREAGTKQEQHTLQRMDSRQRIFTQATVADLAAIRRFVQETAAALAIDGESAGDMILAVNEAANNVLRHGYGSAGGDLEMVVSREGAVFSVLMRDGAPPYDPTQRPPPDTSLGLSRRPLGGMGVHLMRKFTNALQYRMTETGQNELKLVKYLPEGA